MKRKISRAATMALGLVMTAAAAQAATVNFTSNHVFNVNDVQCDKGIIGSACLGSPVVQDDGLTYLPIDSSYGWFVKNFDASALLPKPMDGVYDDGFVANILDANGTVTGVKAQNPATGDWKTGPIKGEWMKGLGSLKAKAATEHYVVMEHLMQSPYLPTLVSGVDYSQRLKDDGKVLYYWGNYNQEPTPVYLYAKMALPAAWKVAGANYKVTSAKLIVDHDITNSPNDQIRPEDFENENATGILPRYTVAADGSWLSAVDSYEGGDGEFIPAGTVLRDAAGKYTNAWYTTLDRDPFAGSNPRYRLKSSKFGQDLPGVEITQYVAGTPTTTTIDLLSIKDAVTGLPVLADSKNWNNFLDQYTDPLTGVVIDPVDGYSVGECPLTSDFDLMIYVKGEVGKPTVVRSAQLVVEYEDPNAVPPVTVDLSITGTSIPSYAHKYETKTLTVSVNNTFSGVVNGTLTLVGKDKYGRIVGNFTSNVTTTANSTATTYSYTWKAPSYATTVYWTATVTAAGDVNAANNVKTATTKVE